MNGIMVATTSGFVPSLIATCAVAAACAVLSVPVILRRWAFIGEGIGHAGFGGAGTAWALAVIFPAMNSDWMPYLVATLFCIATAIGIGALSRSNRVQSDTAIGIFLVASLAWGIMAQQIYMRHFHGQEPAWFAALLFGQATDFSGPAAAVAASLSVCVLVVTALFAKEITAYCFDPITAHTSGVRTGFIHYLLLVLLALLIVVGMRMVGSVLMTALLVLPGATGMLLSRRLPNVLAISMASGLLSATAGLGFHARWIFMPVGPGIVLTLVGLFVIAYVMSLVKPSVQGANS